MKATKKYFLFSIFFLFTFNLLGQKEAFTPISDSEKVEKLLIKSTQSLKSISSSFIQEKNLEYLSAKIKSEGKFWFKNGTFLRWEYITPFSYIIIINNGTFKIKDGEKTSTFDVKSNPVFKELNDILINTVNGSLMKSEKFEIAISENKKSYQVKLNPKLKEMKEFLKNIYLYFSKKDLSVFEIKMIETEKNYTRITFYEKKINTEINDQLFE